jgi:hypothetical protein
MAVRLSVFCCESQLEQFFATSHRKEDKSLSNMQISKDVVQPSMNWIKTAKFEELEYATAERNEIKTAQRAGAIPATQVNTPELTSAFTALDTAHAPPYHPPPSLLASSQRDACNKHGQ